MSEEMSEEMLDEKCSPAFLAAQHPNQQARINPG
jgi:hypothetical protein